MGVHPRINKVEEVIAKLPTGWLAAGNKFRGWECMRNGLIVKKLSLRPVGELISRDEWIQRGEAVGGGCGGAPLINWIQLNGF